MLSGAPQFQFGSLQIAVYGFHASVRSYTVLGATRCDFMDNIRAAHAKVFTIVASTGSQAITLQDGVPALSSVSE